MGLLNLEYSGFREATTARTQEKSVCPVRKTAALNVVTASASITVEVDRFAEDEPLTLWEMFERGIPVRMAHTDYVEFVESLNTKREPTEAELEAAKRFNERVREINGTRYIR